MNVSRATILGAVLTPPMALGYFAVLGLAPPTLPTDPLGPVTWLVWCLAAIGVLIAGGIALGLRVVPLLGAFLVLGTPWTPMLAEVGAADEAVDLFVPLLGIVHVLAILATVEYVTRPDTPRPDWSVPRRVVVGGVGLAVAYLLVRATLLGVTVVTGTGFLLRNTWLLIGQFVLGATTVMAWHRYRTVLPTATVLGVLAVATVQTRSLVAGDAALAAAITPVTVYAVAWVPLLSIVVAVTALETGLRSRLRSRPAV
ncbi:MAG: hypothetical protein ABEJ57_04165 [Halobacteriaceae archaeon]